MKRFFFLFLLSAGMIFPAGAKTQATGLVCEYLVNPVGIDVKAPRLSWQMLSDGNNAVQTAYEIRVAGSPDALNKKSGLIWNSGKTESAASENVAYEGPELTSGQRVYWQVRIWDGNGKASAWSEPAFWEMGLLSPSDWKASWIAAEPDQLGTKRPSPYFRKEFPVVKKVQSARVYVTAHGLYQLFLNGKRVSDDLFTPGWTSYNKRLQYQTYDVTPLLQSKNAIGAVLGNGWFCGNIGWKGDGGYYGKQPAFLMQLQITYADGTTETIITDGSWKTATGPIRESDIYNGETYDAREEMPGWNLPGFGDSAWKTVNTPDLAKDKLVAPQGVPVKATQEIKPLKVFTTPKGETVLDLGQNMVGWVRLKVKGNKGDQVTLKFAEVLDKEGNFYTDNLRRAKVTDHYILKGGSEEVYEPHFTFHGFRYVKLENFPGQPTTDNITGIVIHSAMDPAGTFTCSDSLINKLQQNIQWGQRGNFLDVPTDCPQRDERLGWTGDAQVFSMTAAFNFNVAAFYTKWMKDVAADQSPNGRVPHVIPDVLQGEGGSTAWADVSVIVPWTMYRVYGDRRILEEQYPSMKGWVEYMKGRAGEDYLWTGDTHYGDWLAFASNRSDYTGATTEKDLIATAYFCYSTTLLSKIAGILGNQSDAQAYAALAENIKKAFNKEFVTPNGRLVSHTQTAYVLALAFDLLPENLVDKAVGYLAEDVRKFKHLTTGFVGTPLLCETLSKYGHEDLAFMLLTRKQYPSWLYPVTQGATTIWERWDGQKPDGTFQDVGMNSFNHYAYGAIGEWLYSYVGGIRIDVEKPGYWHILLHPHTGGGLSYANTSFKSMYGEIRSDWKLEGNDFVYEVVIPANTTATVTLPKAKAETLTVNSKPVDPKTKLSRSESGISLELGSGKYLFRYSLRQ